MEHITSILAILGLVVTLATPIAAALERAADGLLEYAITTESKEDDKIARRAKSIAHGVARFFDFLSENLPVVTRRKTRS